MPIFDSQTNQHSTNMWRALILQHILHDHHYWWTNITNDYSEFITWQIYYYYHENWESSKYIDDQFKTVRGVSKIDKSQLQLMVTIKNTKFKQFELLMTQSTDA